MSKIKNIFDFSKPILSDGAMGTMLNQRNIPYDKCFDNLNLTNPGIVGEIHRAYIDAGSHIIQTNTFGANRFKLSRYNLENKIEEINIAGVELARRTIMASFQDVLLAGDIGPLGINLAPFGRTSIEDARKAFLEQASCLHKAGVDLFIIETMTDLYEIVEAIKAVKSVAPDLPLIASMTFTRDDRTLLGDQPEKVALKIKEAGADIIGANCSGGPNQLLRILKIMKRTVPDGNFSIMPNAGFPEHINGRVMYAATPEYFGEYAVSFWKEGANIIGGCCGTTPEHISAMVKSLQNIPEQVPVDIVTQVNEAISTTPVDESVSEFSKKLKAGHFSIAVEMDPPRGLSTNKLLAGASLLSEAGADVINVADNPMASMRMSPWAVCNLIERNVGAETILHFPTRGRNILRVQGDLLAAHSLGIRNVFVVMGDPTSIGDYPEAMDNYDLVPSGLIKLIKQCFNTGMDHAGSDIGQPTSFFVGCALNLNSTNRKKEIKVLKRKIDAGADFVLTQPIYELKPYIDFLEEYKETHGEIKIPILIGILPLVSERHASFLQHEVPGINIPEDIFQTINTYNGNKAEVGIKIAIDLIEELKPISQGAYIMPAFYRYDYAAEIIEAIQ